MAKVPVTEGLVFKRLRRMLRAEGKDLKRARVGQVAELGRFYIVSAKGLVAKDVDVQAMAKDAGLIQPWEAVER
jgi:hypothetical protein